MGMPITTYNVLNALDKDDEYNTQMARNTLRTFNAFAFIIYDPDADENSDFGQRNRAFEKKINEEFDYLDHVTGDKLLFFALVDPPKKWLRRGESRSYYQQLLDHQNAIISNDRGVTAFSLAQSLDIPYEMLPCLVITPNFSAEHVVWVRTCSDHVIDQLAWLGYKSASFRHIHAVNAFFADIREEINLCEGSGLTELESSLAKALTDVLSFIIADDDSGARERALTTINELHDTLRKLKSDRQQLNLTSTEGADEQEELDSQLDNLSAKIISFVAHLNTQENLNLDQFITVENRFLEDDSYLMLKTVHRVLDLFNNRDFGGPSAVKPILDLDEETFDYTPGVICLAKVFEKEINFSVVHWIRESLRIRLPQFFNQYDHKKGKAVRDGVNFNKTHDSKIWSPPSMGRSLEVCRQINEPKSMPQTLTQDWVNLLRVWDVITSERNTAAHALDLVCKNSVEAVRKGLNKLSRDGIFKKLYWMKNQYKGP